MKKPVLILLAALAGLVSLDAGAQFKVVGPDGKVTYTDRLPEGSGSRVTSVTTRPGGGDASLPYELRQAVQKYPVTLYTANDCEPCRAGRDYLQRRGIPFNERTATTPDDKAAWQKTVGTTEAPVLMVGTQQLRGFTQTVWNDTLDAAGYPAASKLPPNYEQAPATPLAPPRPVAATKAASQPQTRDVSTTPSGTGGIRF